LDDDGLYVGRGEAVGSVVVVGSLEGLFDDEGRYVGSGDTVGSLVVGSGVMNMAVTSWSFPKSPNFDAFPDPSLLIDSPLDFAVLLVLPLDLDDFPLPTLVLFDSVDMLLSLDPSAFARRSRPKRLAEKFSLSLNL